MKFSVAREVLGKFRGFDRVDEIERSMRRLSVATGEAQREVDRAADTLSRLERFGEMTFRINVVGWEMLYVAKRTLEGMGKAMGSFVREAANLERMRTALETIVGEEGAKRAMPWVREFARTTPYEIAGVFEAFVRLHAYGIDAVRVLRTVGDTAAAMGKPLMQAVEALADAMVGEFERMKEFGVRARVVGNRVVLAWQEAGKSMHIAVPKEQRAILDAVMQIWNRRFAGGMVRLSRTFQGTWSNILDTFWDFRVAIGERILPVLTRDLQRFLAWVDRLKQTGEWEKAVDGLSSGFLEFYRILRGVVVTGWRVLRPMVQFAADHPRFTAAVMASTTALAILTATLGAGLVAFGMFSGAVVNVQMAMDMLGIRSLGLGGSIMRLVGILTSATTKLTLFQGSMSALSLMFRGQWAVFGALNALRLGGLANALDGVLGKLGMLRGVFYGLVGLISAVNWPIVLLAGAIATLATAWIYNWGNIREKTQRALAAIGNVLLGAIRFILGVFKIVGPVLWRGWVTIARQVFNVMEAVSTKIVSVWAGLFRILHEGLSHILDYTERALRAMGKIPKMRWATHLADQLRSLRAGVVEDLVRKVQEKGEVNLRVPALPLRRTVQEVGSPFIPSHAGTAPMTASGGNRITYIVQNFDREAIVIRANEIDKESLKDLLGQIFRERVYE